MEAGSSTTVGSVLQTVRNSLAIALGFSLALNLVMLALPLSMLQIYERVLGRHSTEGLTYITLIILAALAALTVLELIRRKMMLKVASWMEARLAGAVLAGDVERQSQSTFAIFSWSS